MSDFTIPSYRMRPEGDGPSRLMLLVAGGLLAGVVVIGGGLYLLSGGGRGGVPVIEADSRPIKVRPSAPGGMVVPNQEEQVLERPGASRAEQVLPPARLAPGPEAPQLDRLREQVAATTPPPQQQAQRRAEAVPAAVPPRPAAPPPAAPAASQAPAASRWQVQVAALPSEAAARAYWGEITRKVPELASRQPAITRLDRDGQPTLWRLRTHGLADAAAARALCEAVKAKGAACVPVPPAS